MASASLVKEQGRRVAMATASAITLERRVAPCRPTDKKRPMIGLSINTKNLNQLVAAKQEQRQEQFLQQKGYVPAEIHSAPLPSPPPSSPSNSHPIQRLANLASLMLFVLWFDIPLVKLVQEWNVQGSRYASFRMRCEKVLACTRLSPSVVIVALKYVQLVKTNWVADYFETHGTLALSPPHPLFPNEVHIWAACLLLAHKFVDDKHYSNSAFAQVHGLPVKDLNNAERECLRLLNYRLAIMEEEYFEWRQSLQDMVQECIRAAGYQRPSSESVVNGFFKPTTTLSTPLSAPTSPKCTPNMRTPAYSGIFSPSLPRSSSPFGKGKMVSHPYISPISPSVVNMPPNLWTPPAGPASGGPLRPQKYRLRSWEQHDLITRESLHRLKLTSSLSSSPVFFPPSTQLVSPCDVHSVN